MSIKRIDKALILVLCIALASATLLCGCAKKGETEATENQSVNDISTEVAVSSETQNVTSSIVSSNTSSKSSKKETTSSKKEESSKASASQSSSAVSSKPAKEKIDCNKVIKKTASELKKILPELKYSQKVSNGNVTDILLNVDLSENDVMNKLHDKILDLVEYDLYLEYKTKPEQASPVIIDHTYSISYKGISSDGKQHIFKVAMVMNEQKYKTENFDSDEVILKATEKVLNSTDSILANMTKMTDRKYSEIRMIEGVQTYEGTEEASASLARYVENEIIGVLLSAKNYTQFKIEFYSKGNTSYTFVLYLK